MTYDPTTTTSTTSIPTESSTTTTTTPPDPTTTSPPPSTTVPIDSIDEPATVTEPAVRGPQTVEPLLVEDCLTATGRIPHGRWEPVAWPDNTGTAEWSFTPCRPILTDPAATVVVPPAAGQMLPVTGVSFEAGLVAAGGLAVVLGVALRRLANGWDRS